MLWLLIGVIVIAVIWALVAAYNGKPAVKQEYMAPAAPVPQPEYDEIDIPKASHWEEGAKTSVSKNFGKGGIPTGVSSDAGGIAAKKKIDEDDWMKKAKPFEPRAMKLKLDEDTEEVTKAV